MNHVLLAWTDAVLDLSDVIADAAESAYVVGGAVRDAILRRPIKDIDIVTPDKGIKLARRIANWLKGAFYPLDESRDIGRVIVDRDDGRLIIDVSGLRAPDLTGDLLDRDFTINAIAVDLKGDLKTLVDPLGGAQDLIDKKLRRCSPSSLADDPIRVLRAIRQSVQFSLRIEPETLRDIKATAPRLSETSPERVRDEWIKLLALAKPTTAVRIADALGVLSITFPELEAQRGVTQSPPHVYDMWSHTLAVMDALKDILNTLDVGRTEDNTAQFNLGMVAVGLDRFRQRLQIRLNGLWSDDRPRQAVLMLAALLHDVGKPLTEPVRDERGYNTYPGHEKLGAEVTAERLNHLKLSNAEIKSVTNLIRNHLDPAIWQKSLDALDIYRYWRRLGEDGIDLILLTLADYLGTVGTTYAQDVWLHLVENAQILFEAYYEKHDLLVDPPMLVNGDDLMRALNLKPGPIIRELLELIREGQVSGQIESIDGAMQAAKLFLNGSL